MSENLRELWRALPRNLSSHIEISVFALALGVALSVPLAIYLSRRERLRYPVLTAAGVVQTVPSLALLALMVPLIIYTGGLFLGLSAFGFYPAVIALTLYSILPILRNTVTGILGVEPDLIEAARGVGMTERQVLWKVTLPLAAPVILAGIRTATVWTVGAATLATPVGQRCLGNYIFTGLQTRNWIMVLFGVFAAASLAILLDLLLAGLEKAARQRNRRLAWTALGALAGLLCLSLASPALATRLRDSGGSAASAEAEAGPGEIAEVQIGAKTFTEQYILAEALADRLRERGFQTSRAGSLGSTVIFDALRGGDIDVYVDYSGTIWANYMSRSDVPPRWWVLAETEAWLAREHGIRSLGSLGFENAYVLAVRRETADRLGLETIGDLAEHAGDLTFGSDYEFLGRPEWRALRSAYDLRFADETSLDSTLMYEALSAGDVDVISAFSSDGRIAAYDLVVLEDPKGVIPPYDALLLLGPRVSDAPGVVDALEPLAGSIGIDEMRAANLMVEREEEKKTPAQAARWLLERAMR